MNILIVDDEPLARKGLAVTLEALRGRWEIEAVYECANGDCAMETLQRVRIDVVFTDIEMPQTDGIQLLQWIHAQALPCRSVVLSCHDNYRYVRSAFKNAAVDYLLKYDIDEHTVSEVLRRAIGGRREAQKAATPHSVAHRTGEQRLLDENPLEQVVMRAQELAADQAQQQTFKRIPLRIIWARSDKTLAAGSTLENRFLAAVRDLLMDRKRHENLSLRPVILRQARNDLVLLDPDASRNAAAEDGELRRLSGEMAARVGVSFSTGLSTITEDLRQLPARVREAWNALQLRFHLGPCAVVAADEAVFGAALFRSNGRVADLKARFVHLLLNAEGSLLSRWIDSFAVEISRDRVDPAQVRNLTIDIVNLFHLSYFEHSDAAAIEKLGRLRELIDRALFLVEIEAGLRDVLVPMLCEKRGNSPDAGLTPGMRRALRIIHGNYCRHGFSLAAVAEQLRCSPSYLSRQFKKEMGVGVVQYIHDLRLLDARRLLNQGRYLVYEVAELVGFSHYGYFAKLYRRKFGSPPRMELPAPAQE